MDDQQPDSTKKLAEGREFVCPATDRLTYDGGKLSTSDNDVIIIGDSCTDATMVNKDTRLGSPGSPVPTSTTYQTFQHDGDEARHPALPKLTIKRTAPPQLTSFFCDAAPVLNDDGATKEPDDPQPLLKLKITKDTQVATEYQPIPKLTIKTNYLEQGSSTTVIREEIPDALPKLKLKTTYKAEEMTPLEIVTPKMALDAEEACQKSPRIILKINKTQTYCVSTSNCTESTKQPEEAPAPPSPLMQPVEQENGEEEKEEEEKEEQLMDCVMIDDGDILKEDLPLCGTNEMSDMSFSNSIADNCIIVPDESNSDCLIVKSSNSEDPLQLQNFNECFPTTFEGLPTGDNSIVEPPAPPEVPVKRRRGRPRKNPLPDSTGTPTPDSTTTNHQRSPSPTRKVRRKRTRRTPVVTPKVQTPKTPPARQKFNKNKYFRQKMIQEKLNNSIQLFEEDTRMSGEIPTTSSKKQTGTPKVVQSSQKTMDSSSLGEDSSSKTITKKSRGRMEVNEEGGTEFTVEMLAEYDWPPPVGCCPNKNRDTYMLQEQIAELLGVKSFKRKYPYLYRRPVEMEERNYLIEKKLVSEKMSNLGLTAVYAVDILDIMYQDFNDKYEEYKKYHREKQLRDTSMRQQKGVKVEMDKATVHEKALKSTASWNTKFNKMRNENRMGCIDLQSFIVNIPRRKKEVPPTFSDPAASAYPVELIPGQYSTQWEFYTPASLIYYPLKTARPLNEEPHEWLLNNHKKEQVGSSSESSSDSGSESSSASSESFSDSEDENTKDDFCSMCPKVNMEKKPQMQHKDDHNPCKRKGGD